MVKRYPLAQAVDFLTVIPEARRRIPQQLRRGPWLDVFCPGCGASRAIDLRTVERHPLASVGTLVLGLRFSWCPGSAPMPKLLGLYALPPARRQAELR